MSPPSIYGIISIISTIILAIMTIPNIEQAIANLNYLIANPQKSASKITFKNEKVKFNWLFRADEHELDKLKAYIQNMVVEITQERALNTREMQVLFITLQNFLNIKPKCFDLELTEEQQKKLVISNTSLQKFTVMNDQNKLKNVRQQLPEINFDPSSGRYTSPDDDKVAEHSAEAARIFFSTQWQRVKGWLSSLLSKIGIHVFETARYAEHDYLDSDIYAHDLAIDPSHPEKASHYWIGHASNFLSVPTEKGPLNVLTDPLEGNLIKGLYPRMTKEGNLIEATDDRKLPKVDVVIISHNHRDHLMPSTLALLVKQQPKMIVPQGDEALLRGMGFKHVVGLQWWEQAVINDDKQHELLRVTAVPDRHWSQRTLTDKHRSAFNGYVLQSAQLEGDIYFAGDTALMDDSLTNPLFEHFNITTSIQPGGPDERRSDMESTHQSSADGILMHFKMLKKRYDKAVPQGVEHGEEPVHQLDKAAFLHEAATVKTIYNHTATFKLGNLRLRDTHYSLQRVIAAFHQGDKWAQKHLALHEFKVYQKVLDLSRQMTFNHGDTLSPEEIGNLILQSVVSPKIGQRQAVINDDQTPAKTFQFRDLITNRRALISYDNVVKSYITTAEKLELKTVINALFENYKKPWYAIFSRNYRHIAPYLEQLQDCQSNAEIVEVLDALEDSFTKRRPHGHMQSLIHFARWLIDAHSAHGNNAIRELKAYYTCQDVNQLINKEIHHTGHHRKEKQDQFARLSDKLATLPHQVAAYQQAIQQWKMEPTQHESITVDQLMATNRNAFFKQPVTSSQNTIDTASELLGGY